MVCFLSSIQGPVQAKIRPAMWIPGVKLVHSHREKWDCPTSLPGACVEEIIKAVDRVQSVEKANSTFLVNKVDRERFKVQIFNWTWAEWLDVVEIEFKHGQEQGTEAEIFCFVPFWDKHFNRNRLERLRSAMQITCKLQGDGKEFRDPQV